MYLTSGDPSLDLYPDLVGSASLTDGAECLSSTIGSDRGLSGFTPKTPGRGKWGFVQEVGFCESLIPFTWNRVSGVLFVVIGVRGGFDPYIRGMTVGV